jgi:DNA-nicking Smr family endonuclease
MKRALRPEETTLWAAVAATVRLAPGRAPPPLPEVTAPTVSAATPSKAVNPTKASSPPPAKAAPKPHQPYARPETIEPRRKRRIVRGRDEIAGRLDLHGLDQDRARQALHDFLLRAHDDGARAVLVITGKGRMGDGVLRRRAPEWLADPSLRSIVAGLSQADRHHGGEGAFYIALKRKTR